MVSNDKSVSCYIPGARSLATYNYPKNLLRFRGNCFMPDQYRPDAGLAIITMHIKHRLYIYSASIQWDYK